MVMARMMTMTTTTTATLRKKLCRLDLQEESNNHPPSSPNNAGQDQGRQDAGAGTIARADFLDGAQGGDWFASGSGGGIAFADSTGAVRDGAVDLRDEVRLDDLERGHLLADAAAAVKVGLGPPHAAGGAALAAVALLGRRQGRGPKLLHDAVVRVRRHLRRPGHPSSQVGLEGALVDVALAVRLARGFVHDVILLAREEDVRGVQHLVEAVLPFRVAVRLTRARRSSAEGTVFSSPVPTCPGLAWPEMGQVLLAAAAAATGWNLHSCTCWLHREGGRQGCRSTGSR